jgi:hypothetical protein
MRRAPRSPLRVPAPGALDAHDSVLWGAATTTTATTMQAWQSFEPLMMPRPPPHNYRRVTHHNVVVTLPPLVMHLGDTVHAPQGSKRPVGARKGRRRGGRVL